MNFNNKEWGNLKPLPKRWFRALATLQKTHKASDKVLLFVLFSLVYLLEASISIRGT